ncbi:MAG: lysophospholipid acyltransferase family protein [Gammaproteobacteria bacterium]|nr:lysophospholipid acyltransferase family protein [Gammaproteobacteria bacterium]
MSVFSVAMNHRIGALLGYIFYYSHSKFRKFAEINLTLCFPHLSETDRQSLLKNNMIELGKSITELGFVWTWPIDKLLKLIKVTGIEQAQQAIKDGHGVIILTPHLGCWEMAGYTMGKLLPITNFYQTPKLKGVDKILQQVRTRSGAKTVSANRKGLVFLLKELKNAKATGILPDQTPKDRNSGVFAPFFGQAALTMTLVAGLVQKTQAKVFIGYAKRLPNGKGYQFDLQLADERLADSNPEIAASTLNKEVEKLINQTPEQYLWNYKRFKQVPEGKKSPY